MEIEHKEEQIATGITVGKAIMKALGIDEKRLVTKIVLTIEATECVRVEITEYVNVLGMGATTEVLSRYKLVEDDGK